MGERIMATRDEIKLEIRYLILAFTNFLPTLEGSPNTVDVFMDILGEYSADILHKAVVSCIKDPGRLFAPLPGELLDRAKMFIADEKSRYKPPATPEVYLSGEELVRRMKGEK